MTPDVIKLLKRTYGPDGASDWDAEAGLAAYRLPEDATADQRARLEAGGWMPGRIETLTHESGLARLIAARDGAPDAWAVAARRFLAGVSGQYSRGCSAVLDFLAIRDLKPHVHEGARACDVCGLPERWSHDKTRVLMSAHMGHSGNEMIQDVVVRAEETRDAVPAEAVAQGWARLSQVLSVVAEAAEDETPSALEKRLAKAKALPKTDKWRRTGILQTLAECGVLPSDVLAPALDAPRTQAAFLAAHEGLAGSPRSDIVLPLAAWRGRNGVDASRAEALFGEIVTG